MSGGSPPIDVHNLMAAVLRRAIQDYHLDPKKQRKKDEAKYREEAQLYILDESRHLFSFRTICTTLGMDWRRARTLVIAGEVELSADRRQYSKRCVECGTPLTRHNDLGICRPCISECYGGSRG